MGSHPTLTTALLVLVVLVVSAACGGSAPRGRWSEWKARHGKVYPSPAHQARARATWRRHSALIRRHNSRDDVTFKLAMNHLGDQQPRSLHRDKHFLPLVYQPETTNHFLSRAPPTNFDWRTHGVISPVQNQGAMGNAAAIAVTADLESLHVINTGQLVSLSVREVVDCCSIAQRMLVPDVYECIARHGGLCSAQSYPPSGHASGCHNNSCSAVAKVPFNNCGDIEVCLLEGQDATRTVHVPRGREDQMVSAVLHVPLVVYMDASRPSFQMYTAGVYSDPQCGHSLDHALQLVGYGVEHGTPYWILKNSWGVNWGMQGYILVERGVNMCGVADNAFYPQ